VKVSQQVQQTTVNTNPKALSVSGGIGQPDPRMELNSQKEVKLADDVVTLSVSGGIGQPDPKMLEQPIEGAIARPTVQLSAMSVSGGIGQPDPR
jgi:hypothetical protein